MNTKLTLLASVAASTLSVAGSTSASAEGWYYEMLGGGNWLNDDGFHRSINSGSTTFALDTEKYTGFIISGAVGKSLNNVMKGLRIEGEVAYRENNGRGRWQTQHYTTTTTTTTTTYTPGALAFTTDAGNATMRQTVFSLMANVWYDFNLMGLAPYVGGGIGWADVDVEGRYWDKGPDHRFSASGDGFAWQLGAGLFFPIDDKMKLGIGYRYLRGPDVSPIYGPQTGVLTDPSAALVDPSALPGELDTESHSATVSLKVDF